MLQDKLLIWKLKQGSSEALQQIYEKYEAFLITVALALSHRTEIAEDTVHDVVRDSITRPTPYPSRPGRLNWFSSRPSTP